MKVFRPGFPVQYVDEEPPVAVEAVEPVVDQAAVDEAIRLATERAEHNGTQVLEYTRNVPSEGSPLVNADEPDPVPVIPPEIVPAGTTADVPAVAKSSKSKKSEVKDE